MACSSCGGGRNFTRAANPAAAPTVYRTTGLNPAAGGAGFMQVLGAAPPAPAPAGAAPVPTAPKPGRTIV